MKLNKKSVLEQLKSCYKESEKENKFNITVSEQSLAEESLKNLDITLITTQDIVAVDKLLKFSNPKFLLADEVLILSTGKSKREISFGDLNKIKAKDFLAEIKNDKHGYFSIELKRKRSGKLRESLVRNFSKMAQEYTDHLNKSIVKTLKHTPTEDFIYHLSCDENEMDAVFDGTQCVAYGNSWDFHPGCHGLKTYKKIKLGDWNGAGSLKSMLSLGLKKKTKRFTLTADQFSLVCDHQLPDTDKKQKGSTIRGLLNQEREKAIKKREAELAAVKSQAKVPINDMLKVLTTEFGKKIFKIGENPDGKPIITIAYGCFFDCDAGTIDEDLEDFVREFKGWYVEIMDGESIAICPL
jgi:hypothetical protein